MRHPLLNGTIGLAAALSIIAGAHAESFAVKPGAWDMTTQMSGMMIPPDVLAKMPPDRRAMIEKRIAEGSAPQTRKSCVRKEDLDQDRFLKSEGPNCSVKPVTRTSTKLVMAMTCTGERAATGTMTFEAKSPENVVGSIDLDRGNGGKMHIGIAGKWAGSSCDGIPAIPTR